MISDKFTNQLIKDKSYTQKINHINFLNQKFNNNIQFILASASPRRKNLLQRVGLKIKVIPSHIKENAINGEGSGEEKARTLASLKAKAIATKHNGIIIGADTIVILKNIALGKPKNEVEAKKMLCKLSGNTHCVITGLAIINTFTSQKIITSAKSEVTFRIIREDEIDFYIASKEPMDKAGAYAIQGKASNFVTKLKGSYSNVVGLPMEICLESITELLTHGTRMK